jgi:hypothetical protein
MHVVQQNLVQGHVTTCDIASVVDVTCLGASHVYPFGFEICFLDTTYRMVLCHPSSYRMTFAWHKRHADYSLPFSNEVKNAWSIMLPPPLYTYALHSSLLLIISSEFCA